MLKFMIFHALIYFVTELCPFGVMNMFNLLAFDDSLLWGYNLNVDYKFIIFNLIFFVFFFFFALEQIFGMAEKEMEYRVELFNK